MLKKDKQIEKREKQRERVRIVFRVTFLGCSPKDRCLDH